MAKLDIKLVPTQMIATSLIDSNKGQIEGVKANPRVLRDDKFRKLKKSIQDNPDMMALRELMVYEHEGRYFTNWRNRASVIEDQTEINIDKMKAAEMRELLHKIYTNPIPTTVMDEMKPNKDTDHPTMKPVRLFGYQMQNSSKPDDIVLDTFAGSGTTVIAAEQLGRRARLCEIDPRYCDVILSRYIKFKGSDDDVFLLKDDKKVPYCEIKQNEAERLTNVGQPTDTLNG